MNKSEKLSQFVSHARIGSDWTKRVALLALLVGAIGCHHAQEVGPGFDRPFPLGQVSDAFWETQQTNAEAADFIFFDHDFRGDTPALTPAATKKLEQMALRLEHVPFPVVVEQSPDNRYRELDIRRHRTVVEQLARLGAESAEHRVVIAPAFAEGFTSTEGERSYFSSLYSGGINGTGGGLFLGGRGGQYR